MRFGCCLNMMASKPDGTGIELIDKLAGFGYDYAELPLAEISALSDQAFNDLKKLLDGAGVKCEVCNNFFPKTIHLTGQDVHMDQILDYAERALERARILEVEYVVFGSGPAKNVPEGFSMEQGYVQVVSLLKQLAVIAEKKGITIVIEPLRKAECNLINSFKEGCILARDVASCHVKVLVDFYHMTEEQEPVQNISCEGRAYLRHVHFARPEGRGYPNQLDEADYEGFRQALKEADYDGRISCEAYSQDFDKDGPGALAFFRANF